MGEAARQAKGLLIGSSECAGGTIQLKLLDGAGAMFALVSLDCDQALALSEDIVQRVRKIHAECAGHG